jgi:hypothetical protein
LQTLVITHLMDSLIHNLHILSSHLTDSLMNKELMSSVSVLSGASASSGERPILVGMLCDCCEKETKMTTQRWFLACHVRVDLATKHAGRLGAAGKAAFVAIRKLGKASLREALNTFDAESMQHGRGLGREPFDWLQYSQRITMVTEARCGGRHLWMTVFYFAEHQRIWHGWDKEKSVQKFKELLDELPVGQVNSSKDQILYKDFNYIDLSNSRQQAEDLRYGHKQVRNPGPGDFQKPMSFMGKDHKEFSHDQTWCRPMGLGEGAMSGVGSGAFSRPSGHDPEKQASEMAALVLQQHEMKVKTKS